MKPRSKAGFLGAPARLRREDEGDSVASSGNVVTKISPNHCIWGADSEDVPFDVEVNRAVPDELHRIYPDAGAAHNAVPALRDDVACHAPDGDGLA